jgi:hypothetical protein
MLTYLMAALRAALYGWFIDRIQRHAGDALHFACLLRRRTEL